MKKTLLFITSFFILTLMQPLPAKNSWISKMQYIPVKTDACVTLNLKTLREYMEKNGFSRDEILRLFDDEAGKKSLEKTIFEDFFSKLKRVAIVFDSLELKKKQPKEFLILIEGDGEIPNFKKSLEKVEHYTYTGKKVYEIDKKDGFLLCRINNLYMIGSKKLVEGYLKAKKAKKKTISPSLMKVLKERKKYDMFLYFPLARLMKNQLKKTVAIGKGMGGSGLDQNVFIKSLYNLQYVTAEGAFRKKITFSFSMYGKNKNDAQRLTMLNHFFIVGVSFIIPFADKLSRSLTKKKLDVDNKNLIRIQKVIGRIKTRKMKNGTRISFSLTEEETNQLLVTMKEEVKKAIAKRKIKKIESVDIFEVLKKNDLEALKSHLASGKAASARNKQGETLLYAAASSGNLEAVKLIIASVGGVNGVNENDKKTPLHGAVMADSLKVAAFLIEKGADVNKKDTFGHYPLHLGIKKSNGDLVKLLIAGGAQVNVKALDGETPLHAAAGKGSIDIITILLKEGADKKAKDFYGDLPVNRALKGGHKEAAALLK